MATPGVWEEIWLTFLRVLNQQVTWTGAKLSWMAANCLNVVIDQDWVIMLAKTEGRVSRFTMTKVAAMEEMNLIYKAFSDYLVGIESRGEFTLFELMVSFRSSCHREPIGGMFLESVIEELLDRVKDGEPI
jgi:hypothetical protein